MNSTYVQRHVVRTTRNLLAVNGIVLLVSLLFAVFVVAGAAVVQKGQNESRARLDALDAHDVLDAHGAADLRRPTRLIPADLGEARLAALAGKAVELQAPQAVNTLVPVARWIERATGKRKPKGPPSYFVVQTGATHRMGGPPPGMGMPGMIDPQGGPAFVIVPPDFVVPGRGAVSTFVGVVRPLTGTDRQVVEGVLRAHGVQAPPLPYVLDGLDVGAKAAGRAPAAPAPPSLALAMAVPLLLLCAPVLGLSAWNVSKGVRRLKNPSLHPVYAKLSRYGHALDMERQIEAEYRAGAQRSGPVETTASWLLAPSFWGLDVVPLEWIVWIYRPQPPRFGRYLWLRRLIVAHTLIALDRLGKRHVVRAAPGNLEGIVAIVRRGRPWMEAGDPNPFRLGFGMDRAGFIAAVEARRRQMAAPAGSPGSGAPPIP